MDQAVQDALGQLNARLVAQEAELQRLRTFEQAAVDATAAAGAATTAATTAATAAAAAVPLDGGGGAQPRPMGIDTRQLSKPEQFKGEALQWREWSLIFRSYASIANKRLGTLMRAAETVADVSTIANSIIGVEEARASQELHHLLINLCRGPPLTLIINAGEQEGLRAWNALAMRYEPKLRSRQVGQLMELLRFPFGGDVLAQLGEFEKEINIYCVNTGETFSDRLRCGIVTVNLPPGPVRDHMIMHVERLGTWATFREELEQISRVQQLGIFTGTQPMDIGQVDVAAVGKGGKGDWKGGGKGDWKGKDWSKIKCYKCGKEGHVAAKCPDGGGGKTGGRKGDGKHGGKVKDLSKVKCYKCGKFGHVAAQCRSVAEVCEQVAGAAQPQSPSGQPEEELNFDGLFITCITEEPEGEEAVYLHALGEHGMPEQLTFGVDSGAEATVVQPEVGSGYPATLRGTKRRLRNASGGVIPEFGDKQLVVKDLCPRAGGLEQQVIRASTAQVHKNLLAVADLVDAGHDVLFTKVNPRITHLKTGRTMQMRRRGKAFEIDFQVVPYEKAVKTLEKASSSGNPGPRKA